MDHEELIKRAKTHTFASWIPQNQWNLLRMLKVEQINEGLNILDHALSMADKFATE